MCECCASYHACMRMFSPFSCAILLVEGMLPKQRRSMGPLLASVVEVLTPRDPFVNRQQIFLQDSLVPKGNPTIYTANDIVVPTASMKVIRTCRLHTSSQQATVTK